MLKSIKQSLDHSMDAARRKFVVGAASLGGLLGFAFSARVTTASAPSTGQVLDAHSTDTLVEMSRQMFPNKGISTSIYRVAIDNIGTEAQGSAELSALISQGIAQLDGAQGQTWLSCDEETKLATMRSIESSPFFQLIMHKSIDVIYRDPEVWRLLGYEGSSIEKGGYLHRGFDDIDWLP